MNSPNLREDLLMVAPALWLEFEMNSPNLREELLMVAPAHWLELMRPAVHLLVERETELHHPSTPVLQAPCHHHHLLGVVFVSKIGISSCTGFGSARTATPSFDSVWSPRLVSSPLNTRPLTSSDPPPSPPWL